MAFPTDLDSFADNVDDVMAAHVNAIQAKIGVDDSAVTTSHDYKLSEITSTDKSVGKTATQTLTNKTLTSPVINTPTFSANAITALGMISSGVIQVVMSANLGQITAGDQTEAHWGEVAFTPKRTDSTIYALAVLNTIDNGGGGRMTLNLRHETTSAGITGTLIGTGQIAQDSTSTNGLSGVSLLGSVAPGNTTLRYFKVTAKKEDATTTWYCGRYSARSYILLVEVRA